MIKQLLIRNQPEGMIWQVYTVESPMEVAILRRNAVGNGFYHFSVVELEPEHAHEETFPGWREHEGWKTCVAAELRALDLNQIQQIQQG